MHWRQLLCYFCVITKAYSCSPPTLALATYQLSYQEEEEEEIMIIIMTVPGPCLPQRARGSEALDWATPSSKSIYFVFQLNGKWGEIIEALVILVIDSKGDQHDKHPRC